MGAPRRRDLLKSRRRVQDEGEEEEGSVAAGIEDDSLSEGSAISDADDDADGEGSDGESSSSPTREGSKAETVANGHGHSSPARQQSKARFGKPPLPIARSDTDAMMNGLQLTGAAEDQGVAFEDLQRRPEVAFSSEAVPDQGVLGDSSTVDRVVDRRRKEHEEYKKRRDADPAFVPNRGGFFMHDHRSAAPGQNGFRPFGRGRGRVRGAVGRPLPPTGCA